MHLLFMSGCGLPRKVTDKPPGRCPVIQSGASFMAEAFNPQVITGQRQAGAQQGGEEP